MQILIAIVLLIILAMFTFKFPKLIKSLTKMIFSFFMLFLNELPKTANSRKDNK